MSLRMCAESTNPRSGHAHARRNSRSEEDGRRVREQRGRGLTALGQDRKQSIIHALLSVIMPPWSGLMLDVVVCVIFTRYPAPASILVCFFLPFSASCAHRCGAVRDLDSTVLDAFQETKSALFFYVDTVFFNSGEKSVDPLFC